MPPNSLQNYMKKKKKFFQKRHPNLFKIQTGRKKWCLTSILMYFCQKSGHGTTLSTPPPSSAQFYCYYRPPRGRRSPAGLWFAVQLCQWTFQLVSSTEPCRVQGWRVLSQACSLALSKWTDGAIPFWANSWNSSDLHITKLSGPQYLTVSWTLVQLGLRIKRQRWLRLSN